MLFLRGFGKEKHTYLKEDNNNNIATVGEESERRKEEKLSRLTDRRKESKTSERLTGLLNPII